ncbi:hypothetical protein CcI156_21200 [Frankia sp. CcI156]|uniref:DUF2784 domain-containing protein n=1 Tax=Frankia casuarinae (strain DSM 45818 / CECT 9043 / HFP020203 / CcI3) TaxID=106370 RepID=Q2JB36_FRACC|nr:MULTISPECIES: DUF2784 domain-containing protein [Frankia]ABD11506.1 conserved hypothetical protein [Frankia casuarinae]ETA00129.1 hypothetical protein CcI6DRAFT_04461 [Frankia sp. CcI6]EYT90277.1 hypothetical protein ThrDRAFT_04088 [Frankia casuarinae]KDA41105.1 hypothetical protein BMG523Draft_04071 [Frankia sp. BMG5.23]KEZ34589.1 Protein of Unknown function (DUF2784) [Frankia sp. CeD]
MTYDILADLVVVAHLLGIAFIIFGGLLVRRRRWLLWLHVPAVIWGVTIITIGFTCPLTPLEKYLRRLDGQPAYQGGFIDHYLAGVLYPDDLTWLVRSLAALIVVVAYVRVCLDLHRRRSRPTVDTGPDPASSDPGQR